MKILDSTIIIAIANEIHYPELIDKIRQLGHKLVIPSHIVENELHDMASQTIVKECIRNNKIQILNKNTIEEIQLFQKMHPKLGLGESDSMLAYQKLQKTREKAYCILDDSEARKEAVKLGIKFTGLIGLLQIMKQRRIMNNAETVKVMKMLKNSNFRLPSNVVI